MIRKRMMRDDDGFSLVEVVVAMGLATVVLLALISSSVFGLKATLTSRQNQQAADYLNLSIESARSLAYAGVSMLTSDLAGDPAIVSQAGVQKYDPGTGLEPIDSTTTGQITPHVVTENTSNGIYTTKRYVTIPSTAVINPDTLQPSVRRLTVEVSWNTGGQVRTRRSDTLLTLTRRGLPLPNYTWTYNGPASVVNGIPTAIKNPGNAVSYGLVLANLGARDSWSVTASTAGWTYYQDTNRDGLWSEDSTEPQVSPGNTGLIEPGTSPVFLVAYRLTSSSESTSTTTTVFTATSDALPAYSKTLTTKLSLQAGAVVAPTPSPGPSSTASPSPTPAAPCTPGTATTVTSPGTVPVASTQGQYTLTPLELYNSAVVGDSATVVVATMGPDTSALEPQLCNWSTDLQTNQAGRLLTASGTTTATRATFAFQPQSSAQDQFRGEPVVTVWVQCPVGTPNIAVELSSRSGTVETARGGGTLTTTGCTATGFTRFSAQLTMSTFSIGTSDTLLLRLTTPVDVRLGFGATSVPATLTIGMK